MTFTTPKTTSTASVAEEENLEEYPDRVSACYVGKTIFITGGTGFMGKVLVEKLLRVCTGVKKIYLLVRSKKGKDPNERLKDVFNNPLFNLLKSQQGDEPFKKVKAIAGDVAAIDLDISPEDRKTLIEEVNVIFHCAATIRFDEVLKKAVLLNVRGTKYMLELAKQVKDLDVFAHLSTAYCHLNERILAEKPYPPPASPHHVIKTVEWMSEEIVDSITDKLLGDIPNTYAFTKALGEALAVDEMDNLPIVILRPSVVIPVWKEPIPGWTDNINGPTGLLIGAGKGVIRSMYCNGASYADYLPVDVAVNGMILCVYDFLSYRKRRIYNLTSSAEYKVSWDEIIDIGRKVIETRMPLNGVVWYPGGSMKRHRWQHNIAFFFTQLIPAILIDMLLFVLGYKPVLCRVQRRIQKGYEVFEYYANNQWDFENDESLRARDLLNPREKKLYKVDGDGLDMVDYFTDCTHAARLFILNETDDTIPQAKRHMKVMWYVDKIFKALLIGLCVYFLLKKVFLPLIGVNW